MSKVKYLMDWWSIDSLETWNDGMLEYWVVEKETLFQYSSIPTKCNETLVIVLWGEAKSWYSGPNFYSFGWHSLQLVGTIFFSIFGALFNISIFFCLTFISL